MPYLIRQATLAKKLGISRQTVFNHCRIGGRFHDAMVGNRVDFTHPSVLEYAEERASGTTRKRGATSRCPQELPESLRELQLCSIVGRFRGEVELLDWLRVLKLVEEIRSARLKNDEYQSQVIDRELVATHVFGATDEVRRGLLGWATEAMVRTAYENGASAVPLERTEVAVREVISKVLSSVYGERQRVLREQATAP